MKQSVQGKRSVGLRALRTACTLALIFTTATTLAQRGSNGNDNSGNDNSNNTIPELSFSNPTLTTGSTTDGKDGAIYKFANVASGIDATVQIVRRSSSSVVLTTIDNTSSGWNKALQPTVGIQGTVSANQTWWMEFEVKFYSTGSSNSKKVKNFKVTALDVDGDGQSIKEIVQMEKVTSLATSSVTSVVNEAALSLPVMTETLSGYNLNGSDKRITAPVTNYGNIDTNATQVMATFTYDDKDAFRFVLGGKSGSTSSNAGMRLNSLWFKAFSLLPNLVLPVKLTDFNAQLNKSDVTLSWNTASEENFSHYVIERSTDGTDYADVALVFSDGGLNSNASYQYKDKQVSSATGVVYYRLRMTEKTNSYSYSPIRVIRLGKEAATNAQLATYPNPVLNDVRVTLPAAWQGKNVVLEVYTSNGIRIKSETLTNASQTETLSTSALPKGFYLVRAQCKGRIAEQKIIHQ